MSDPITPEPALRPLDDDQLAHVTGGWDIINFPGEGSGSKEEFVDFCSNSEPTPRSICENAWEESQK